MPYTTVKKGTCYSVVNKETGQVHSKCSSQANAIKQMRLLYGLDSGWKPSTSYRDFVKREFQKRPSETSASSYMKTIAAKWRAIQSKK
jgi:hypothetical protein